MLPTTPTTAFELSGKEKRDPILEYLSDLYTVPASMAGMPAISIPWGKDKRGLPIGIQLVGKKFDEANLLAFAQSILG